MKRCLKAIKASEDSENFMTSFQIKGQKRHHTCQKIPYQIILKLYYMPRPPAFYQLPPVIDIYMASMPTVYVDNQ